MIESAIEFLGIAIASYNCMTKDLIKFLNNKKIRNSLIVIYILTVLGFSVASKADMKIAPFPGLKSSQVHNFVGDVVSTLDGEYYLIVSDHVFYRLSAKNIDFQSFDGLRVIVTSLDYNRKIGPIVHLQSIDLEKDGHTNSFSETAPELFVIKISELVE